MCSAYALDYQSSHSFRHTLKIGDNISAEVAEYEAGEVLFCQVGAKEVATSVVDKNNCERSLTALG